MRNRIPTRTVFPLFICAIAAISTVLSTGITPTPVFGDDNITIRLTPTVTNTEPPNATSGVEINTQTGQMHMEILQATPNATYTVLFLPTNGNIQLGTFATDTAGHGTLQAKLPMGVYAGIFEVLRAGVVQFTSATVTITIGTTTSVSVTETTSQTIITSTLNSTSSNETGTRTTMSNWTLQTEFHVEPSSRSVAAGAYASYNINIRQQGTANVFLAARGVPPKSVAIFSQDSGLAAPEFHSTLTIVTSPETAPATYSVMVVALVNGQEHDAQVAMEVTASTITTQTTNTITVSARTSLSLTLDTDVHHYEPNATVYLQGQVTDDSGNVIASANVDVQVDAPGGAEVITLAGLQTDAAGVFQATFTLPLNAQAGTYTAFASASKQGYIGATTRTTFVVASSSTPSVVIQAVYTGDSAGNPITVFSPGQTVYVWVVIENIGSTFQGVIWVQIRDPNGIPVQVLIRISSLIGGQTFRDGYGFTLLGKPSPGLYTVNALVSDNMISQGGVFLASSNAQFAVTPS